MQDRVSASPGRVLITPESGEAYYATIERADNPTVVGTPLNKANLLTDATAALFSLGNTATPNTVFSRIKTLIDNNSDSIDELTNSKAYIEIGSYVGTGTYGESNPTKITFSFSPIVVFLGGEGEVNARYQSTFIIKNIKSMIYFEGNYGTEKGNASQYSPKVEWGEKSVSISCESAAAPQFNFQEKNYYYVAIG